MTSYVIIQDTWNEDDDVELLEYFSKDNPISLKIMNEDQIKEITDICPIIALFCNTEIIQYILKKFHLENTIPDTYEHCFNPLFNRKISKHLFSECSKLERPFFIKPFANDKSFNAKLIESQHQIDFMGHNIKPEIPVYISEPMNFVNEYRIFLGNEKIYGITNSSSYIHSFENKHYFDIPPPIEFLQQIQKLNNFGYCVVDIGLCIKTNKWCVVEVNPPFSISSYDYPINDYIKYSIDAWSFIKSKLC